MVRRAQDIPFATRLKAARNSRGLTLQQMADALHIGIRSYQHYEAGTREPTLPGLRDIAVTLGVSADHLLGIDSEAPSGE